MTASHLLGRPARVLAVSRIVAGLHIAGLLVVLVAAGAFVWAVSGTPGLLRRRDDHSAGGWRVAA